MCNAEECPGPYQDFRAQQCSKRNSYYTHQNSKHAWLPYEHHDGERRRVLAKEQEPRCLLSQEEGAPVAVTVGWRLCQLHRGCWVVESS